MQRKRGALKMFVSINNCTIRIELLKAFYPCDVLGNFDAEDVTHTCLEFTDGTKGVYFFNYSEFISLITKVGNRGE